VEYAQCVPHYLKVNGVNNMNVEIDGPLKIIIGDARIIIRNCEIHIYHKNKPMSENCVTILWNSLLKYQIVRNDKTILNELTE